MVLYVCYNKRRSMVETDCSPRLSLLPVAFFLASPRSALHALGNPVDSIEHKIRLTREGNKMFRKDGWGVCWTPLCCVRKMKHTKYPIRSTHEKWKGLSVSVCVVITLGINCGYGCQSYSSWLAEQGKLNFP